MTLGKITVDNFVRHIPKNEQTKGRVIEPNTLKNNSNPRKRYNSLSQNNEKFIKNVAAGGFAFIN